ncbi:MAG: carbohydrate binding family 9 domain-containing protein, partial [Gemmatimonadetes bacterium]|nr:carbohydrate binding family 9 domain-containing protein [Gemmatimonadota bacterium]
MHLTRSLGIPALLVFGAARASAQTAKSAEAVVEKTAQAVRFDGSGPDVDGRLDEPLWRSAAVIRDFVQKVPIEGAEPSERTEVMLLYDDAALYVGARMFRANPGAIRRAVTRRDGDSDAEVLVVSLDTYYDRRTAYSFAVSSGGVRKDYYHGQDSEDNRELQFDPVWLARARVDSLGWTAEMRIPFSQLRFTAKPEQLWGLEIKRAMPDKNEDVYWVMIPRAAAGFASHFGALRGITGIRPSRRLEVLPYTAGELTLKADPDPRDPFDRKTEGRLGADLKMGLGPNLTLDATVNPDFGQVEADPAEVNLTAFETVFDERRPFFTEGNELLTGRGLNFLGRPSYYYSRRIGAPPHGSVSGDYTRIPINTTILGATKLSGRLASGLSIGVLGGVTPREWARSYDSTRAQFADAPVEPPAGFGVVRLQQELGKERSTLGWTLTGVRRAVGTAGGLNGLLAQNAIAGGTDWRFRFQQGKYEFTGWVGFSRVEGDTAAIRRLQRTSAHYFQRPDQDHVTLNPQRTSLSGYTASVRGDKNAGRFSVWGIQVAVRSPGFEINDAG